MSHLNMWFIIEIMSFYGYIMAAMFFLFERSFRSTFGWLKKSEQTKDVYQYDILAYFKRDTDWYAFITILMLVNLGLQMMDTTVFNEERQKYGEKLEHS